MQESRQLSLLAQLRVVLMSYVTRPGLRWALLGIAVGAGIFGIAYSFAKFNGHDSAFNDPAGTMVAVISAFAMLFGAVGFAIVFLLHARQQLIGLTARVLPNTRTANLIIAATAIPLFAGIVTIIPRYGYQHLLGLFAVWFAAIILACYAILRPWTLVIILSVGWYVFSYTPLEFNLSLLTVDRQKIDYVQNPYPYNLRSVVIVKPKQLETLSDRYGQLSENGRVLIADQMTQLNITDRLMRQHYYDLLQTRRISILLGDIIAYLCLLPLTYPPRGRWSVIRLIAGLVRRGNGEQARRLHGNSFQPSRNGMLIPAPEAPGIRRHNPITTQFARSLHRRLAAHDWRAAGVAALAMALLSAWFTVQLRVAMALPILTLMLAVLPGALVAVGWRERWPTFEFESLYPISRAEQITGLAIGLVLDVAEFWIASAVVTVAVCTAIRPGILHDNRFWTAILAGGLMQCLWLGGIFLVGQRRQLSSYVAGLTVVVLAIFLPLEFLWRSSRALTPGTVVIVAVVEMIVGVMIFLMTWALLQRAPRATAHPGAAHLA